MEQRSGFGVGEGAGVGSVKELEKAKGLEWEGGLETLVSTETVTELLISEPSALVLPARSVNWELATEMTPSVVLLVEGVKVAE